MARQNHAAPCALAIGLDKGNWSKWRSVVARVSVVKSQIAGTATRALAQVDWRAAMTSTGTAAQYDAPRKAPVRGRAIVHAKYVAVWSVKTVSWKPARNTSALAAYRSHRIGAINGRTPGGASNIDMPGPHAGNRSSHKNHAAGQVAGFSVTRSACLALIRVLNSVLGIPSKSLSISRYIAIDYGSFPHGIGPPRAPGPPGGARQRVRSLHGPEVSRSHGPGGHSPRVPRSERRGEADDDQDHDEPDPTVPGPRGPLRHRGAPGADPRPRAHRCGD